LVNTDRVVLQSKLEIGNAGLWREGKTEVPEEKPLGTKMRTNLQQTQPTYVIEPGK